MSRLCDSQDKESIGRILIKRIDTLIHWRKQMCASITRSREPNENSRTAGRMDASGFPFFPGISATASLTLLRSCRNSSAPSSLSGTAFLDVSVSSNGEGANLENRVSSSSGSSTFVYDKDDRIRGRGDSLDHQRNIFRLKSEIKRSLLHHITK